MRRWLVPALGLACVVLAGCPSVSQLEQARSVRTRVIRPAREPGIHGRQYVVLGKIRTHDEPFNVYIRYTDPVSGKRTFLKRTYPGRAGAQKLAPVVRAALFSALSKAVSAQAELRRVLVMDEEEIGRLTGDKNIDLYYGSVNVGEIQNAVAEGKAVRVEADVWGNVDLRRGLEQVTRGTSRFADPYKKCNSAMRVRLTVTPSNDPGKLVKQAEYVTYYIRQVGGNPMPGLGPLVTVSRQELLKDIRKSVREQGQDPKNPEVAKAMTEVLGEMPVSLLYTSMGRAYREGKLAFFHDAVDRLLYDRTMAVVPSAELLKNKMAEDICTRFAQRFFPVATEEDVIVADGGDRIAAKKLKAGNLPGAMDRLEVVIEQQGASKANVANMYNLGVCYEASGQARAAYDYYDRAAIFAEEGGYDEILALARAARERTYGY